MDGWNGLENSSCRALFLSLEDDEDGVTVMKQGQGWTILDVYELCD